MIFVGNNLRGDGFTGYLLGHKIQGWVPLYFPLAWAIKFPIPLQMLTVAGLAALCARIRRREAGFADLVVWGAAAFFFGAAILSNYHIGFRHALPGAAVLDPGRGLRAGSDGVGSARRPNGRSCISHWRGSPSLRCASTRITFRTSTNGSAVRRRVGGTWPTATWIGARTCRTWERYMERKRNGADQDFCLRFPTTRINYLKPGSMDPHTPTGCGQPYAAAGVSTGAGRYAVSASFLVGFLLPQGCEDYLEYFRWPVPGARAGYSILIYDVKSRLIHWGAFGSSPTHPVRLSLPVRRAGTAAGKETGGRSDFGNPSCSRRSRRSKVDGKGPRYRGKVAARVGDHLRFPLAGERSRDQPKGDNRRILNRREGVFRSEMADSARAVRVPLRAFDMHEGAARGQPRTISCRIGKCSPAFTKFLQVLPSPKRTPARSITIDALSRGARECCRQGITMKGCRIATALLWTSLNGSDSLVRNHYVDWQGVRFVSATGQRAGEWFRAKRF